jgi:hypothetical protein
VLVLVIGNLSSCNDNYKYKDGEKRVKTTGVNLINIEDGEIRDDEDEDEIKIKKSSTKRNKTTKRSTRTKRR